jgi:hypothetical protein
MGASILSRLSSPMATPPFLASDLQYQPGDPNDQDPNAPASNSTPDAQPSVDSFAAQSPVGANPEMGDLLNLEADQTQEAANEGGPQAQSPPAPSPPPANPPPSMAAPSAPMGPPMPPPLSPIESPIDPYDAAMGMAAPSVGSEAPSPSSAPSGPPASSAGVTPAGEPSSPASILTTSPSTTTQQGANAKQVQDHLKQLQDIRKQQNDLIDAALAKAPPGMARRILGTIVGMFAGPALGQLVVNPNAPQIYRTMAGLNQKAANLLDVIKADDTASNIQSEIDTRQGKLTEAQTKQQQDAAQKIQDNLTKLQKGGAMEIPLPADGSPPALPAGTYRIKTPTGASPNTIWVQKTPAQIASETAQAKAEVTQQGWGVIPDDLAKKLNLPPGIKASPELLKAYSELAKPATPTEVGLALQAAGGDPVKALNLLANQKRAEKPTPENIGTWTIQEDSQGNPILLNTKTGGTKPAEGVQKSGTKARADAATEKLVGPARDALAYADTYAKSGQFTGPGDEALMEKFFELAKPSTGFRMSQQQIDMLKNARSWLDSARAAGKHGLNGEWFADNQRQQITQTMRALAAAKGIGASGAAPASGGAPKVGDTFNGHKVLSVEKIQ